MKANIARYIATLSLLLVWGFSTEVAYGQTKVPLVKPVAAPPVPIQPVQSSTATFRAEWNEPIRPASHVDEGQPTAAVPIVQAAGQLIPVVGGVARPDANSGMKTSEPRPSLLSPATRDRVLIPIAEPLLTARPQPLPSAAPSNPLPLISPQAPPQTNELQSYPMRVPAAPRISSPVTTQTRPSSMLPSATEPGMNSGESEMLRSGQSQNNVIAETVQEQRSTPSGDTPPDYSFYLGRDEKTAQSNQGIIESVKPAKPLTSPNKLPTVVPADNYLGVDQLPLETELDQIDSRSRVPGRGVGFKQDVMEPQAVVDAAPPMPAAGNGDCPHCGGTGCNECGMLAGPWSDSVGNNYQDFDQRFDCCGFVPGASEYAILDVLYWTRNQGGIVGTNFGGVRGYDYDFGGRVTIGQRPDRIHGREFTYFGIVPLEQSTTQTSAAANINARFTPLDGLGFFETSAFFNGVETTQRTETEFHSVAFDRTRYGWDIVKTNIGLRYIYVDDKYSLASENFAGHQGVMGISGRNHLFGGNIGLDLFYDVGRRVSFSWFGKLGGYLNANRTSLDFTNRGVQYIANRDSSAQFAASIDLGVNAHYHINNNARFRLGYGGLWVTGVSTAGANYPRFLTPVSGLSADDESDVFFHGFNVGFELFR